MLARFFGHFWWPNFYRDLAYEPGTGLGFLVKLCLCIQFIGLGWYATIAIPELYDISAMFPVLEVQGGVAHGAEPIPRRVVVSENGPGELGDSFIFDTRGGEPPQVMEWMTKNHVLFMVTQRDVYSLFPKLGIRKHWSVGEYFGQERHVDAGVYRQTIGSWVMLICCGGIAVALLVFWLMTVIASLLLAAFGWLAQYLVGLRFAYQDWLRIAAHALLPGLILMTPAALLLGSALAMRGALALTLATFLLAMLSIRTERS